jgi:hypothetical protein
MVRSGDAVERLNESSNRLTPGLFGRSRRQRDKKLVNAVRMRAVKLEVCRNVPGFFAEARGRMHHLAGDGVDLARRESFLLLALAAPCEQGH